MTYVLSQAKALDILNESIAKELGGNAAVSEVSLVDKELSPEFDPTQPMPRRETFQAHSSGGRSFRRIKIAPPTDLLAQMLDWSAEALPAAKFAAKACSAIYEKTVEDMPRFGNRLRDPLPPNVVEEAWLRAMEAAFFAMNPEIPSTPSSPLAAVFMAECACAARDIPSLPFLEALAWKDALSDWAFDLDPVGAMSMLALAPLAFTPRLTSRRASAVDAPERGLRIRPPILREMEKSHAKPNAYQLCQNGSFSSSVRMQSGKAADIAEAFVANPHMLGLEHAFHRHYLSGPEGVVHGAAEIKRWADATIAFRERLEIGAMTSPGKKSAKPKL